MPLEKNFRRLLFFSNIIKIPRSSKRRSIERKGREIILKERERKKSKKEKKEKEKEKLQESLQIERGSQYFERRKILQLQNLFCTSPFSSPPSYHFKNPFQNHLRKFHNSFWTIL
jgi:hypothetical protein